MLLMTYLLFGTGASFVSYRNLKKSSPPNNIFATSAKSNRFEADKIKNIIEVSLIYEWIILQHINNNIACNLK